MRSSIGVMLGICLWANVLSGCGSQTDTVTENNNLTEKDKAATMENGAGVEAADTAELGNDQTPVTEEGTGEITLPEEELEFWGAECILEIGFEYGVSATQEDIIHIGQCSHLKHLQINIYESEIDLSPLANLTELETLDIRIIYSPDLSFMQNLTKLEELSILASDELDFSPIGSLTGLRRLRMSSYIDNPSDLSFLKNLNQLTEVTIVAWYSVKDLSYFQNMQCLQNLYVTCVDDVDLNYLSRLTDLETLTIAGENIRNIEGIGNLINLKDLSLYDGSTGARYSETEPLDIRSLENLTQLESIELEFIHLEDITPLAKLKRLRDITLVSTKVEDISPLIGLENLHWLHIYGNKSKLVKEQAETYFSEIEYLTVTEELPNGY